MEATCYNGIPEPLWDDIFLSVGVNEGHLRLLSTMSKQFLLVSNRLKQTLNITTMNQHYLSTLLKRFPNVKHMNLPFFVDPASFFGEIARFNISLESLDMSLMSTFPINRFKELPLSNLQTTLRSLKLTYVEDRSDVDGDLVILVELFPNLEEVEFFWSYNITNTGVLKASPKLKKLRRVSFSGNVTISDPTIRYLAENCMKLEELELDHCLSITGEGISFAFRHCRNMKSIVLKDLFEIGNGDHLALARKLSSIQVTSMDVTDDLLRTIARANIPLKRISLSKVKGFTLHGLVSLLGVYHSLLEYFAVEELSSRRQLKGENVVYLAPYLWNVMTIKLNYCCKISASDLLALVNSCPKLNALEIKGAEICKDKDPLKSYCDKKFLLASLNLSFCNMLSDEFLAKVSRACPNLTELFANGSKEITHNGVSQVMRSCHGLRTIEMNGCINVFTLALDIRVFKLEVVKARGSSLDDESLSLIALKCPDLICLEVTNCSYVTGLGVREVVVKCKNLVKLGVSFKCLGPDLEYWIRSKKPWLVNRCT